MADAGKSRPERFVIRHEIEALRCLDRFRRSGGSGRRSRCAARCGSGLLRRFRCRNGLFRRGLGCLGEIKLRQRGRGLGCFGGDGLDLQGGSRNGKAAGAAGIIGEGKGMAAGGFFRREKGCSFEVVKSSLLVAPADFSPAEKMARLGSFTDLPSSTSSRMQFTISVSTPVMAPFEYGVLCSDMCLARSSTPMVLPMVAARANHLP